MSRMANPHRHPGRAGSRRWPVVVFAAILVASCQPAGILDPQGPIASAERLLLINSTAIMLVVVVPVIVATLGVRLVVPVIQYPRRPRRG
jgi:Heme/copper-type cytochrome/quinol oxidases, subunit 2